MKMKSSIKCRAHLAVNVEDPITIVDADRFLANEPEVEVLRPYVEEMKISSKKQYQLDEMEPQECIPKPTSGRFWNLRKTL